jgi:tRNA-2-methylthio-N6-dimethylallyladenosine synthase
LLGPGKIDELPRLLEEHAATKKAQVAVGFKKGRGDHEHESPRPMALPSLGATTEISRFVNIQQGCDNFCTFCVVPHTRGREVSRAPADVLTEARHLLAAGAREITVLGQNVNSYGLDLLSLDQLQTTEDGPFVDLLRDVAALPGLERLRFTTSNPQNFTPALARLFRDERKMGRYLHLAAQSGSDRTLERMKRKCTAAEFLERVAWLREGVPDMAISTDLIVGLPGETEAEFEATLRLVEAVRFSFSFTFKYSPRKHTPAARYLDQVPEEVKESRLARLNAVQDRITLEENEKEIGQTREVLFLYQNKRFPNQYYGRTEHFRLVRADCDRDDVIGKCLPVKIASATKTTLAGALVTGR